MSEYIRTKDNIYARDYLKVDLGGTLCSRISFNQVIDAVSKKDIIKQADTIEELCDKYYGVDENGEVVRVHNWSKDAYPPEPHKWAVDGFCTKEDITINELKSRFPKGIFGAIVWFDDNGNLHIDIVAKMNDKGKLELL